MDEKEDILLCFTFTTTVKEIIFVNAAIVYSYNIGRIVKQVMISSSFNTIQVYHLKIRLELR